MGTVFISVDVEASGPFPPDYSMLSLGACVVGNAPEKFYVEFQPISDNYVDKALQVSGFTMKGAKENGKAPATAMAEFTDWIEKHIRGNKKPSDETRPKFVAFPAGFDWMFVNYYMLKYVGRNVFGLAPLDIRSVYFGLFPDQNGFVMSKSEMKRKLGVTTEHTHNALDDAIEQGEMFARMLEIRKSLKRSAE
ncbi:MAG: exonuclease domain-containing protein [Nitrososphaera sp.]